MKISILDTPILWINLDKDKDRRRYMRRSLNGLNHYRLPAIEKEELSLHVKSIPNYDIHKRLSDLACIVSHLKALYCIIENKWPMAIVMEDDMAFTNIKLHSDFFSNLPSKWGILQLFTSASYFYHKNGRAQVRWIKWATPHTSAGAYVITQAAAKSIVSTYFSDGLLDIATLGTDIDLAVSDMVLFENRKCYTAALPLAYETEFPSNFNKDHELYSKNAREYLISNKFIR